VTVEAVAVAPDATAVELHLKPFIAGRVYEIRLQKLVNDAQFFPAEAHYTLNQLPPRYAGDQRPVIGTSVKSRSDVRK
jgi:hypothetical protein